MHKRSRSLTLEFKGDAREGDVLKIKSVGSRLGYYLAHIDACLDRARLGPKQREHVMSAGWSKVRLYARLLDRTNYRAWTRFALENRAEVVAQAVRVGLPYVVKGDLVVTFTLRLGEDTRDKLVAALADRGREHHEGKWQGGQHGRRPDDGPVRRLLRDAKRGTPM